MGHQCELGWVGVRAADWRRKEFGCKETVHLEKRVATLGDLETLLTNTPYVSLVSVRLPARSKLDGLGLFP